MFEVHCVEQILDVTQKSIGSIQSVINTFLVIIKLICFIFIFLLPAENVSLAQTVESSRTQEISQCKSDELVTWGDGRDIPAISSPLMFSYNHANAPDWFVESQVVGMVSKAATSWSQCGVIGFVVNQGKIKDQKETIKIKWSDKDSGGNFGMANLSKRTLTLGPKAFDLLHTINPKFDSRETLQMVISHEMGHFWGLMAHSRRCVDVLSYYDNGKGEKCYSRDLSQINKVQEYRSVLPTACDILRCQLTNKMPPSLDVQLLR